MKGFRLASSLLLAVIAIQAFSQQYADSLYLPEEFDSLYEPSGGPEVFIDEFHHNFHTRNGRYSPFARVIEQDGFRVGSLNSEFTRSSLKDIRILVISNALPETSVDEWIAPTASAFTDKEIKTVEKWVKQGGRLFLIADHMPLGGAAAKLASAFGFVFQDGFADDTTTQGGRELFCRANGTLGNTYLTNGVNGFEKVDSVTSFTGQVFQIPEDAESILYCRDGWVLALPDTAWVFNERTPILNASGWSQGAYKTFGKGKIVVFGEAAMFSAQIAEVDGRKFKAGMNSPEGRNNYKLLINTIRWLDE